MPHPFYAKASLILPMNGANNGTTFKDYSPTTKTVTRVNAVTSTASSKYYGSSGYFDGNGDYLLLPNEASLNNFGTGDYTLESWINPLAIAVSRAIFSCFSAWTSSLAYMLRIMSNGALNMIGSNNGVINISSSAGLITVGSWQHIAACRASGTTRIFHNGNPVGTPHTGSVAISNSSAPRIGLASDNSDPFYGYMNDACFTPGQALYTGSFTPPPRRVSPISGHILGIDGLPAARKVYVLDRANGALLGAATSDASTGAYEIMVAPNEVIRIVLADEATLYNDLIDRVLPE